MRSSRDRRDYRDYRDGRGSKDVRYSRRRADVMTIETKRNKNATITNIDFLNLKLIMDGYYIAETSYESLFVLVLLF